MKNKDNPEKVMLGVPDIMKKMGIGRDNAYSIIRSNQFPTIKIGRRYLVHEDIFDKWLKGELKK
jgi:excisionase family DNA binding protein